MDSAEAVLAALDPEQREVALAARGPVCVLAGAGTGKTRAVAHRIAYAVATGVVDPARVLAVTFTTRAAGELRGRLGCWAARRCRAAGSSGSRPGRSTRRRCASSATSGRSRSAGRRRGCSTPRSAWSPTSRAGCGCR